MPLTAAAIIPAAGSGTRMGCDCPKQFLELAGTPILLRTIGAFLENPEIGRCIVAVPADWLDRTQALLDAHDLPADRIALCAGGRRRQDSVQAGLALLDDSTDVVLVHDAARPLVDQDTITRCCKAARIHGAAIAAIPAKDTLKKASETGAVLSTIDRQDVWQAQTPQAVRPNLLQKAYDEAGDIDATDEAFLLEQAGIPVFIVEGSGKNLKITRPEDLRLAEMILCSTQPSPRLRIGHGFDAHRFTAGRPLVLGGITIPHSMGLAGHSDADVVTHALCDALLGAISARDIGYHFPDSDSSYSGICSINLLKKVVELVHGKNFCLANADITIICQAPRLAAHIPAMQEKLAQSCMTEVDCLNVKATTTEKMGYTGREEGISCHAVVLLQDLQKEQGLCNVPKN